jgi:flagellar export protein FliJ
MAFRFRAQAALDLRTRELHDAQRELARLEGDRDIARTRVAQAASALAAARVTTSESQREATDCTTLQWYHYWILRLEHERKTWQATLAAREAAVQRGVEACVHAQQRREALDRFRGKARARYDAGEAAAERKLIDELATRRYAATRQSVSSSES